MPPPNSPDRTPGDGDEDPPRTAPASDEATYDERLREFLRVLTEVGEDEALEVLANHMQSLQAGVLPPLSWSTSEQNQTSESNSGNSEADETTDEEDEATSEEEDGSEEGSDEATGEGDESTEGDDAASEGDEDNHDRASDLHSSLPVSLPSTARRSREERKLDLPLDWQCLEYVGKVDDDLVCSICLTPFHKPVVTFRCRHEFCGSCLDGYLDTRFGSGNRTRAPCPVCRTRLELRRRRDKFIAGWPWRSRSHLAKLEELRVRCPNGSRLCSWTGQRSKVEKHVRHDCEYTHERCIDRSCEKTVSRGSQSYTKCLHYDAECRFCKALVPEADHQRHHRCDCPKAMIPCEACREPVRHDKLDAHEEECWEEVVACAFAEEGCPMTAARQVLREHEKTCLHGKFWTLSKNNKSQAREIAELRSEVARLQSRSNAQDTTLHNVRQEFRELRDAVEREHKKLEKLLKKSKAPQASSSEASAVPESVLSLLDNFTSDMIADFRAMDARISGILQRNLSRFNSDFAVMNAQVSELKRLSWMLLSKNHLPGSSGPAAGADGTTDGQGSSAWTDNERRLSDQTDRARM